MLILAVIGAGAALVLSSAFASADTGSVRPGTPIGGLGSTLDQAVPGRIGAIGRTVITTTNATGGTGKAINRAATGAARTTTGDAQGNGSRVRSAGAAAQQPATGSSTGASRNGSRGSAGTGGRLDGAGTVRPSHVATIAAYATGAGSKNGAAPAPRKAGTSDGTRRHTGGILNGIRVSRSDSAPHRARAPHRHSRAPRSDRAPHSNRRPAAGGILGGVGTTVANVAGNVSGVGRSGDQVGATVGGGARHHAASSVGGT
ncbi:MAG: hypothetical protein J2P23_05130, partial [Microlunatus sp.]|nr:hypothetical protein [Microlunatus sp.]